ncbi:MAG: EamA family transporter [Cyclobacteriaceae bacterium]|nr:EamA family transporter [Cyclobacteriaceae bacterium]
MLLFVPSLLTSLLAPNFAATYGLYIPQQTLLAHMHFFLKAIIVGTSWILAYFAMKNLPITIVGPIRASSPFWTLIGAVIIFNEQFTALQWIGIVVTLTSYYAFALVGKKEGIHFSTNKWVYMIILATIIGAISGLYDKYLLVRYDRLAVQAWFSVYLVVFYLPILIFLWYPARQKHTPFQWRYAIFFIGLFLILADYAYFYALSYSDSLIGVIASLRRGSVVISFFVGAMIFKDKNLRSKKYVLAGILLGVLLIYLGS